MAAAFYQPKGTPVYTRNGDHHHLGGQPRLRPWHLEPVRVRAGRKIIRRSASSLGFLAAQQVRVDRNDNIWVVDRYSSMVIKLDPEGHVAMLLGRKPESVDVPSAPDTGRGSPPGSGAQSDLFQSPTDVAWDAQGNIFVADGIGNARIAKFTRDGVFVKSWGSRGTGDSSSRRARIAVDASGNVYVADRGNNRIQVFDNDGNFKSSITSGGDPAAICITPGAHQYLFSSNTNPANDLDHGGEIYKLELNGTVVGKFGQAGKGPRDFGTVTGIDCRNANSLYVAEAGNWRVTKVDLH